MGNILGWEGLVSSARLQEMAVDGLLNRYLLLALQHSHLYYDSLEKAKAVGTVILLQNRLLLSDTSHRRTMPTESWSSLTLTAFSSPI